jgi:hypothetical protein
VAVPPKTLFMLMALGFQKLSRIGSLTSRKIVSGVCATTVE